MEARGKAIKMCKLQGRLDPFPEEKTSWLCSVLCHPGKKSMNGANFRATDLLSECVLLNSAFLFVGKTLQVLTKKKLEFAISYSSVKDDRSQHGMPHTATQTSVPCYQCVQLLPKEQRTRKTPLGSS